MSIVFFCLFFFLTQFKVVPKFINTLENHCKGTLTRVGPAAGHPTSEKKSVWIHCGFYSEEKSAVIGADFFVRILFCRLL